MSKALAAVALLLVLPSVSASDLRPGGVDPSDIVEPDGGLGGGGGGSGDGGSSCSAVGLGGTPPQPGINWDCITGPLSPSPPGDDD